MVDCRSQCLQCKVELHNHLDGALRAETLISLARSKEIELPVDNARQLKEFVSCENKERSLKKFLEAFTVIIPVISGDVNALRRCAIEFCEDQANQGVLYTEVRYAPQLLTCGKSICNNNIQDSEITSEQALVAIMDGLAEGCQRYGVKVRSILCCLRSNSDSAMETLGLCKKYHGKGVVGIDIEGNEREEVIRPGDEFCKAYEEARRLGIHRTAHAGEAGTAENIRQCLDWLNAERIGHGYQLINDEDLFKRVKKERIHIEVCPTSSILTGSCPSFDDHPAKQFITEDLNFSINSDDSFCCNSGIADEYKLVYNTWGYDASVLTRSTFNAAYSSFLPEKEKQELIGELQQIFGASI